MATVRDVLEKCKGKTITLFLRDRDTTSMHQIESIDRFNRIDILDQEVLTSHISKFKDTYHIELSL